jgi:hypothetical protein
VSGIFVTQSDPMWILVGATLQPADHSWSVLLDASAVLFDCPTIVAPSNPTIDWGDGPIEDAATITLIPLGGGAADDLQIAGALTSGKTLLLAPGTWNIGGAVVVYPETQELHGPAPASRGAIRLSYGDELTHAATTEGTWSRATYDATFNGTIDHTIHDGYNWHPTGGPIDPAFVSWYWQMEVNYVPALGASPLSEWFIQYNPAGGGPGGQRPIGCMVVHATGKPSSFVTGELTIQTSNTPPEQKILVLDDPLATTLIRTPVSFITQASANNVSLNDAWAAFWNPIYLWTKKLPILFMDTAGTGYCQLMLNGSDEFCIGTTDANSGGIAALVPAATKIGGGTHGVQHHGEIRELGPGGAAPVNVQTITGNRTLVAGTDAQIQLLTANNAHDVILPADTCTGLYYWIESRGSNTITVKRAGGATVATYQAQHAGWVKCTGATWVAYGHVEIH